jgi:hypothetical protein
MKFSSVGWPEKFNVHCPSCGECAVFDEPFAFMTDKRNAPDGVLVHRWGAWFVVEKYPLLMPWKAPRGSHQTIVFSDWRKGHGDYVYLKRGVVRCDSCYHSRAHTLNWPDDAYFQWDIRGDILWAWSADHARILLDYISGKERNISRDTPYASSLRKVPKQFLSSKVRDLVIKRITDTLGVEVGSK